jgi:hypothetical protein
MTLPENTRLVALHLTGPTHETVEVRREGHVVRRPIVGWAHIEGPGGVAFEPVIVDAAGFLELAYAEMRSFRVYQIGRCSDFWALQDHAAALENQAAQPQEEQDR